MPDVLNSDAPGAPVLVPAGAVDVVEPAVQSKWFRWRRAGVSLISYLLDSEVHTFAFSVAANAILSFIPFIVLLYTLARSVFHSNMMVSVVSDMVDYFLPSNQAFVAASLSAEAPHHGVQFFSLFMILVACTGIFLPLEVALNQAWGVTKSRNYLFNQSVALASPCSWWCLAWAASPSMRWRATSSPWSSFTTLTTSSSRPSSSCCSPQPPASPPSCFSFPSTGCCPIARVPWRPVLRTAIVTGIIWLGSKYIFMALLPHLDLHALYGPFYVSVGLLFWAYISGLILFAGAQFSVARLGRKKN